MNGDRLYPCSRSSEYIFEVATVQIRIISFQKKVTNQVDFEIRVIYFVDGSNKLIQVLPYIPIYGAREVSDLE